VSHHERHRLGRDLLRGHDQVALVLAIGVVHDHDEPAGPDVLDGVLDGVEPVLGHGALSIRSR
jgi:hypothetical protein